MATQVQEPFGIEKESMEEIGKRLGQLYRRATLAQDPSFLWLQIVNDSTILGEELRRNREDEAVHRAGRVLLRLFEFIGYYSHVHNPSKNKRDFASLLSRILRRRSYPRAIKLPEGPSLWVLYKYPLACAKCGWTPCHCLLEPWVLEERREKPEAYCAKFRARATAKRALLADKKLSQFSISDLVSHFSKIYRNAYYNQDPWKIGMHLSEEIGEATTELSRIDLAHRAPKLHVRLQPLLREVSTISSSKVTALVDRIQNPSVKAEREKQLKKDLKSVYRMLGGADPWATFARIAGERFKEEIADSLSWLAAIVARHKGGLKILKEEADRYTHEGKGGVPELRCPWCKSRSCTNSCLITHAVSNEAFEKASKF